MRDMSIELKNRIKLGLGLLLAIAVGLMVYFGFFAAKAPAEFPDLDGYTGCVTITHGNALLDARMDEQDSARLIGFLAHARFSPSEEARTRNYNGSIRILFPDSREIALLREEEEVFVRAVGADGKEGYYTVCTDLYDEVRLHVYSVFPEGITFENLAPWWEEYFYIASLTLMGSDFNSALEISPEAVAEYTLCQMVADGSAEPYLHQESGGNWYQIPYAEFLRQAQGYFADGANVSLKETRCYREEDNTMLFAQGQVPLSSGERPGLADLEHNGGYRLVSVHRDLMGVLTAELYDYNEVGFTETGVHTRTHYFTMVCGSDGRYRFVSKRSQVIDPAQVSVEGYFLSIGQIGDITPENRAGIPPDPGRGAGWQYLALPCSAYGIGQPDVSGQHQSAHRRCGPDSPSSSASGGHRAAPGGGHRRWERGAGLCPGSGHAAGQPPGPDAGGETLSGASGAGIRLFG